MKLKIAQLLVLDAMPDFNVMFSDAGLDVELIQQTAFSEDEILGVASEADAIIGIGTFQSFTKKVMDNLKKCRFIASLGIGYDLIDVKAASENRILVANVPDYCWEEVSDHIMALMLSCTRRIAQLDKDVKNGGWKSEPDPDIQKNIWPHMNRLKGQVLGLIGFGGVARALVPKAKGFGVKIIAYDPYVPAELFNKLEVEQINNIDEVLTNSDVISLNMNLTDQTRHIIGLEQLKKMKPTANLVNAARGPLVDPKALHTALTKGYIAMAAVDVTEPEPILQDDPLLKLDNFIVTAHSAHFSPTAFAELGRRPGAEIIRLFKDKKFPVGLLNSDIKDNYIKKWGEL